MDEAKEIERLTVGHEHILGAPEGGCNYCAVLALARRLLEDKTLAQSESKERLELIIGLKFDLVAANERAERAIFELNESQMEHAGECPTCSRGVERRRALKSGKEAKS